VRKTGKKKRDTPFFLRLPRGKGTLARKTERKKERGVFLTGKKKKKCHSIYSGKEKRKRKRKDSIAAQRGGGGGLNVRSRGEV